MNDSTYPPSDVPEAWQIIPGFDGKYAASDQGRIYALPRIDHRGRRLRGQLLKGDTSHPRGYVRHTLIDPEGKQQRIFLHRLVLLAFTGENPPDLHTRHLNGQTRDCRLVNLAYGTCSENTLDRIRHGTWVNNNRFVNATHCIHGHEFNEENTYHRPGGGRACKRCAADRRAQYRAAAKAS